MYSLVLRWPWNPRLLRKWTVNGPASRRLEVSLLHGFLEAQRRDMFARNVSLLKTLWVKNEEPRSEWKHLRFMEPSVPSPPPSPSNIHILKCMPTWLNTNTANMQEARAACAQCCVILSTFTCISAIKKKAFSRRGKNVMNSPASLRR